VRQELGPLLLRGTLQQTIWGGRNLARIAGKTLPDSALIGESWETANESTVAAGHFAGMRLGELVRIYDESLVGWRSVEVFGHRFPLLAKFLDAQEQLSLQVHPEDDFAAAHEGGKLGKTESWYVLHADPGAQLVYGLTRTSSEAEVRQAISQNRLEDLLCSFEARPGDVILVPAGTVHAIGGGVVLYELQEYSDVTYRLYDYGRRQPDGSLRELHIDKALAVMRFDPPDAVRATPVEVGKVGDDGVERLLVACRYFLEEELRFSGEAEQAFDGSSCHILTALEGTCEIDGPFEAVSLMRGDTAVVPAAVSAYSLRGKRARVLRSFVPREDDVHWLAWRAAQPSRSCE
jgi:mannose-6-phosphate isomerase